MVCELFNCVEKLFEVCTVFSICSVKMSTPKRKRNLLDFEQKREIIDCNETIIKALNNKYQIIFFIIWELPVKHRTVEDISNKELPANDIVRVNKFDDLQKLYLQTIISVSCLYHEILFL